MSEPYLNKQEELHHMLAVEAAERKLVQQGLRQKRNSQLAQKKTLRSDASL